MFQRRQVSILYWLRNVNTNAVMPLFVPLPNERILPLVDCSTTPPAELVPPNCILHKAFQPEVGSHGIHGCLIKPNPHHTNTPP